MKTMWSDIPFSRKEFECECGCGFGAVDAELLEILVKLRYRFGPVVISGGNRCVEHNEKVQTYYVKNYVPYSSKSYHTKGMAVDAKFPRATIDQVFKFLCITYPGRFGFIKYSNRIHIDVRSKQYRAEVK